MRTILSNHDRRQLEFLELLSKESPISLHRTSERLGYPVRTLAADITQINTYLAPMQIVTNASGVTLTIPDDSSFREVYSLILQQSRETQFLKYLFFHCGQTQEEISAALFISVSTFRRMVRSMKKKLAHHHIELNTAPYCMIGDEEQISQLYIALFSELYLDNYGPMNLEEQGMLAELNKRIADEHGYPMNFPDLKRIILWTYVRLMRMQKGHHVEYTLMKEDYISNHVLNDSNLCCRFHEVFGIKLNRDTLFEMYHTFLRSKYANNLSDINNITMASAYHRQLNTSIQTLLISLAESLGITLADTEQLHIDLFNNLQFTDRTPYILYNRNKIFADGFSREHEHITAIIKKHITQAFSTPPDENGLNEIIYILVSHWPGLIHKIEEKIPVIKIGIFFDSDIEHAQMIADLIQQYANIRIQMSVIELCEYDFKGILYPEVDILITNIPRLETKCKKTVCITEYPTVADWKAIYFTVERTYQELLLPLTGLSSIIGPLDS